MKINYIKFEELKDKFGKLLSYLFHNLSIGLDNINEAMIKSSFLDAFEENNLEYYTEPSLTQIGQILFPGVGEYSPKIDDVGNLYWAGRQYINIFLNYRIPLKSIFIMLPLKNLIQKYDVYHEMNEIELCRDFKKNEYCATSILKYFRNSLDMSVRQLSLLSDIPEPTIKYLEMDNNNFYNASNKTLSGLSRVLNIPEVFFRKKSLFLPVNYNLLTNQEFAAMISITISKFYTYTPYQNLNLKFFKEKNADKGTAYLFVEGQPYITVNSKTTYIDDSLFKSILDKSLDEYLEYYKLKNNLVF